MRDLLLKAFIKAAGKRNITANGALLTTNALSLSTPAMTLRVMNPVIDNEHIITPTLVHIDDVVNYGMTLNANYQNLECDNEQGTTLNEYVSNLWKGKKRQSVTTLMTNVIFNKKHLPYTPRKDVRYYLDGQFVQFSKYAIATVNSDGHRLIKSVYPANNTTELSAIVPVEAMEFLSSIDYNVDVYVNYREDGEINTLEFCGVSFNLFVIPINAKYPDFSKAIDRWTAGSKETCVIDRRKLMSAIKANGHIIRKDSYIGVALTITDTHLIGNSCENGVNEEVFNVPHEREIKGNPYTLNPICVRYLLEMLKVESDKEVKINFNNECFVIETDTHTNITMTQIP